MAETTSTGRTAETDEILTALLPHSTLGPQINELAAKLGKDFKSTTEKHSSDIQNLSASLTAQMATLYTGSVSDYVSEFETELNKEED